MEITDGDLDSLDAVWNNFSTLKIVDETWPEERQLSALEALRLLDVKQADRMALDAKYASEFGRLPIIAVAGLKNAGKSSLIRAFLADENRPRVICGLNATEKSTNRFTLWLPSKWEGDQELLARLKERLAEVFGHAVETLAPETAAALTQQLDATALDRPLIAFDPELDNHGLALVDCPDIETASGETPATNPRLMMLERVRDFCAGVIVVIERRKISINTVKLILDHLPQAARVFALNLVGEEAPEAICAELAESLDQQPEFTYLAFDYLVTGYAERTPLCDPSRELPKEERVPYFFAVEPESENNMPNSVGPERAIQQLGKRIPPDALRRRGQCEQQQRFARDCRRALNEITKAAETQKLEIDTAAEDLFKTVQKLFSKNGDLKFKPDPEILDAMRSAIARNAPKWLWPWIKANYFIISCARNGKNIMHWVWRIPRRIFSVVPNTIRNKFQHFALSSEDLADAIAGWAARQGWSGDPNRWSDDAEQILQRFNNEQRCNISKEEWDELASSFWVKAPKGKAALSIALTLLISLAVAAWIVVQPGPGFLAAKLFAGKAVLGVTTGELLGGLGLTTLSGTAAGVVLQRGLESLIARRQISDLFAIFADRLGLPRKLPAQFFGKFPSPSIIEKTHTEAYGRRERRWNRISPISKDLARLRTSIEDLSA